MIGADDDILLLVFSGNNTVEIIDGAQKMGDTESFMT